MAAQDVKNYADENWNQYLESITELSKEQKNGNALVTSEKLNAIRQMHFVMITGIYSLKIKRQRP